MGKDCCKSDLCLGCVYIHCKCNYACLKCNVSTSTHCCYNEYENLLVESFRQRWVCLDCRYVWSSKYTKWLKIRDEQLNKKVEKRLNNNKEGLCHKCHEVGIKVGDKFRIPPKNRGKVKTNKFWNDLKRRYEETGYAHELDDYCPSVRGDYNNKKTKRFGGEYKVDDRIRLFEGDRYKEYKDENNQLPTRTT